jgi:Zn-dependent metalloprotease
MFFVLLNKEHQIMSSQPAPINYQGPAPIQPTQTYSFTSAELIHWGYIQVSSDPNDQALARTLHQTVETVKSFFGDRFRTAGLDVQGKMPPFFVHLGMNNAFFHPKTSHHIECFAFNDDYARSPEIVCHEFTHGVIANKNPLGNAGEAGAINEAIADVVGIVFKCSRYASQDWIIAGRNLSQPFHFSNLENTKPKIEHGKCTNDNGNVHHNSRLISHAFHLASRDLARSNADEEDKLLLKIWWDSVLSLQAHEKTFSGFVKKTIRIGERDGIPIKDAIIRAWQQVGMHK